MPFLILAFCISLISCENGNEDPESVKKDSFKQVLDGYFVTSIAFDEEGNAWIGTFKQGLIKYNPDETIVYNAKNSIIPDSAVIYDIAIDSKNNVWIGCEGLIKYDGTDFTHYNSSNTAIPEDFVQSIAIDAKDNIWFSSNRSQKGGIVKYNGSSWTVYTPGNSDLPANFVKSIAIDKNDNVWLALNEIVNDAYLVKISDDHWTIYTGTDLGFNPYNFGNIRFNSQNKLYASIDYRFSSIIKNNRPQVFIFDGFSSERLPWDRLSTIKFITIDDQDNVWCAFYGGYAVYNGQKWTIDDSTFKDVSVFAIEQSLDNRMWFGTGDGIYMSDD